METTASNKKTALIISCIVFGMVGMSFAAVPAYKAFCQVTGWGGTTQQAENEVSIVLKRKMTVRFDATVSKGLAWRFKPEQVSQTSNIGKTNLAFYEAENLSNASVTGQASFNVSPAKAGRYFRKVECFCFTEQTLAAGETVSMPVSYFILPEIADDPNLDDVETITLSYTFFPLKNGKEVATLVNDNKIE